MLFNSVEFLFLFLPAVLAISLRLRGQALLRWITLASFFFYAFAGHAWFLVPMLVTTVADYWIAFAIERAPTPRRRRAWLALSLSCSIGLLVYFKYVGLFARTLGELSGNAFWSNPVFSVMLPAGISFYTFQTMSYVIDVYRGHAEVERNFWRFAGFVSFFPHLVAGPLTRHNQLIPGLSRIAREGISPRWKEGLVLFTLGLAKKVLIADRIAQIIDPAIDGTGSMPAATAIFALLGYTLQIYFDFSGYSDMAIGLARLFAIELPQNFNSPYQAVNPSDFWRRWHMTLSAWLRDYLYISLGGNRKGAVRRDFNLMTTMVLGGLWHGANWTFAAWGFYHGALLILFHQCEPVWKRLPVFAQRGLTFAFVAFGWLIFRARDLGHAKRWFLSILGTGGTEETARAIALDWKHALLMIVALTIALRLPNASHSAGLGRIPAPAMAALGVLAAVSVLFMNYSSKFLYFQF